MEKFLVLGDSKTFIKKQFQLTLPKSKHYQIHAVKNGEAECNVSAIIEKAVMKNKFEPKHIAPAIGGVLEKDQVKLPRSLQQILSIHPFPLSQGPVLIPLDCETEDNKTLEEVFTDKTVFDHSDIQRCFEWTPKIVGVQAWGQPVTDAGGTYDVEDKNDKLCLQGAASKRNMSIVYTCRFLKCYINCPCWICRDDRVTCKLLCRTEMCIECNSQCIKHEIKMTRLFNSATDHFTLVTQKMNQYQFAHAYAGIPLSCATCTQDVLQHQALHLIFHIRCRFCRYEMRPLYNREVISLYQYEEAALALKDIDTRTCSVCLATFRDSTKRKQHEKTVHERKENQHKCDLCDKSYSNKNALEYHKQKHEAVLKKPVCELCGHQFSFIGSMMRHKETVHGQVTEELHNCVQCDLKFSRQDSLIRHNKEKHVGKSRFNLDFIEDIDSLVFINCEQCEKRFKRRSDLKRHVQSAHSSDTKKSFDCSLCDKKFSRKSALTRHITMKHE